MTERLPDEPPPPTRDLSPTARLAVTASAPLLAWIVTSVHFATFEPDPMLELFFDGANPGLAIGGLGLSALLLASVLVEVGSFVTADGRRARLAGPERLGGRLRLTLLLAFAIAAFQAWRLVPGAGSSLVLEGSPHPATIVVTLIAGFALNILASLALGRWGLVNGVFALFAGHAVVALVRSFGAPLDPSDELAWRPAVLGYGALALVVVSILAVAQPTRVPTGPAPAQTPYRDKGPEGTITVEAPSAPAGLLPLVVLLVVFSALDPLRSLLMTRLLLGPGSEAPLGPAAQLVIGLLLALATGAAFARPSVLLRAWSWAAGRVPRADLERAAARVSALSILRGVALSGAFGALLLFERRHAVDAFLAAIAVAVAVDAVRAYRARSGAPSWVAAWPEPRPVAVASALEALRSVGIDAYAADATCASLFPLIGPIAPTMIMVPTADVERAREVLAGLATSTIALAAEPPPDPSVSPPRVARDRRVTTSLAALLVVSIAAIPLWRLSEHRARWQGPTPAPVALQMRFVDDEAPRTLLDGVELPPGASLQIENAPLGPARTEACPFVRIVPNQGESLAEALDRARAWARTLATPAGTELAFGPWEEANDDEVVEQVGWRSFVLTGEPVLTEKDVVDAHGRRDSSEFGSGHALVAIELDPQGGQRFAEATRRWTKRRIAIVVDGVVLTAPVVQSEIRGGSLQITMGAGEPDEQLAKAQHLAEAIRAGSQRARR